MPNSHRGPGLRGRRTEQAALDRLLAEVRAGQSRVLVLRGEAGVGKTVLLDYLQERAPECRVVRTAGVESEMELPFAVLYRLCAPLLSSLARLPGSQGDALRTAFGLGAGAAPDASSSASQCSGCSPLWLRNGLSYAWSTTHSGSTEHLRIAYQPFSGIGAALRQLEGATSPQQCWAGPATDVPSACARTGS
jgi:hypothetical protein